MTLLQNFTCIEDALPYILIFSDLSQRGSE